ncbi:diguanylate cyclase [Azovibrio restrictus]|uniref:diguanylate cyclase n=1 Tax=Azovibrio restrictus TaxID=146938 RepID=UPI0026F1C113|nr:diguanylate cyclase [Azovibrio restrictus]
MMSSLYRRLLLMTLLPACFLSLVLALYFSFAGLRALEEELLQRGEDIVRYMAPTSEYGVVSGNWLSLQGMVQGAVQQPDVRAAAVVNRDGRVVAVSGRVNLGAEYLKAPPKGVSQVASGEGWIAFAAPIYRSQAGSGVFIEEPVQSSPEQPVLVGQVFVELDKSGLAERQRELLFRGLGILILALAVTAYFVARLAHTLVLPVTRLVDAVRAMAAGNFQVRVEESSRDELGELEQGFNRMAEYISDVHRSLQERIDEATALLAYQARHDALTGLVNRREFETRLEAAIRVAQGGGEHSAVLFIDLDRFKRVNDSSGHIAGDELLRQLSRQLQSRLRQGDTLARLGGDEFGVLLPGCSKDNALRQAEALCGLVAGFHFSWQDKVFTVGASIGVVAVDAESQSVSQVLSAGDAACYAAKAGGRSRVEVHERQMREAALGARRDQWRERMEMALADNLFAYQAQPLRLLGSGVRQQQLFELTALVDDRQGKPLPLPMEAAERHELAQEIDLRLLQQAGDCLQRVEMAGKVGELLCLLRISNAALGDSGHRQRLVAAVTALGRGAAALCLMLNEETAIQYPAEMQQLCERLHGSGCRVGLDGFGGWIGSLSHLSVLAPDFIRITPVLIRDVGENRSSAALVRALREIADDHGISTIAAGVDDLPALQRLKELGITYAQGRVVAPQEPLECWLEGAVLRHL